MLTTSLGQGKTDAWARHLVEAADVAYADLSKAESWLKEDGCTEVKPFDEGFTQALGFVKEGHRCLVFRGTQQGRDWWMDALCFYYETPPRHFGFNKGWTNVREKALRWLESTADSAPGGVFLAGHSLGAAIAVVAALDLSKRKFEVERIIGFGCPRVGSPEFCARYEDAGLNSKTYRYEHAEDGICVIPPPMLYAHVGKAVHLEGTPVYESYPAQFSPDRLGPSQQPPRGTFDFFLPVLLPFACSIVDASGRIYHLWLSLYQRYPNSKFVDPRKTAVGRLHPVLGCLLFLLVLIAAHLFLSNDEIAANLEAKMPKSAVLVWLTTFVEALLLQQLCYLLLARVPFIARLFLSIFTAGLFLYFFPVRQIEALLVPVLLIFFSIMLLILYRSLGGVPDHFMQCYIKALSARPARDEAMRAATPEVSPRDAEFFRRMGAIARDPKLMAYVRKAHDQVRRNSR
jgi:pimeloyl-ACP methyl ester carboxylesterase